MSSLHSTVSTNERLNRTGPLELVKLNTLMALTSGSPDIVIGLIDGPVFTNHPALQGMNIRLLSGQPASICAEVSDAACMHGTFVAGILCGNKDSLSPAICPSCTILLRPVFTDMASERGQIPSASPKELAAAIVECTQAGARIINMSLAFTYPSTNGESELEEALNYAAQRGVIVVAAAGNQGTLGSSVITRHPWTIPVVACDQYGKPLRQSNLGNSIGKRGLSAPGDSITSLGTAGSALTSSGTSIAAPFVTGAGALLWSLFPNADPRHVKLAITQPFGSRRAAVVPPLLDAWAAYQALQQGISRGKN